MAAPAGLPLTSRRAAGLVAILGLAGLAARLVNWPAVFAPWGVELVPADSHYYVRFAALQRAAFPRFVAFDDLVNFPRHTQIIWPGGHALLVAAAEWWAGAGREEAGVALVGPVLSLAWLVVTSVLALRLQRPAHAAWTIAVLALTPVAIESGALGNADHHVHEGFLLATWALLAGAALERRSWRLALASGLAFGTSRWLTTSAVLDVPLAGLAWVAMAGALRLRPSSEPLPSALPFAAGVGACAAVLSYGAWHTFAGGLPLQLPGPYEVSDVFAVVMAVALAALSTGLVAVIGREPKTRVWPAAVVAAVALLVLAPELGRALGHLAVRDPLLAVVDESQPLWRDPLWAGRLLGPLALLSLPVWVLVFKAQRVPVAVLPALFAVAVLGALAVLQARFLQAWVGAAAVVVGPALDDALAHLSPRTRRLAAWLVGAVAASLLGPQFQVPTPSRSLATRLRPTLEWIKAHTAEDAKTSVLANYSFGHWIVLWAQRPALASTFSQLPWHVEANAVAGDILAATNEDEAWALIAQQRVGLVMATPFRDLIGHPEAGDRPVLLRQLLGDEGALPVFGHFRLLYESEERRRGHPTAPLARVYQPVSGARLHVLCQSAELPITSDVVMVDGRAHGFKATRTCQPGALAELRIAQPGTWMVGDMQFTVTERDVEEGRDVVLAQ